MKKPEVGDRIILTEDIVWTKKGSTGVITKISTWLSTPTANINGKEIELKEGKFEILQFS